MTYVYPQKRGYNLSQQQKKLCAAHTELKQVIRMLKWWTLKRVFISWKQDHALVGRSLVKQNNMVQRMSERW